MPDRSCLSITLHGIACATDNTKVMSDTTLLLDVVLGDTTNNRKVTSADVNQTKANAGATTGSNFRNDVNADGTINGVDVDRIKGSTNGVSVPCP